MAARKIDIYRLPRQKGWRDRNHFPRVAHNTHQLCTRCNNQRIQMKKAVSKHWNLILIHICFERKWNGFGTPSWMHTSKSWSSVTTKRPVADPCGLFSETCGEARKSFLHTSNTDRQNEVLKAWVVHLWSRQMPCSFSICTTFDYYKRMTPSSPLVTGARATQFVFQKAKSALAVGYDSCNIDCMFKPQDKTGFRQRSWTMRMQFWTIIQTAVSTAAPATFPSPVIAGKASESFCNGASGCSRPIALATRVLVNF